MLVLVRKGLSFFKRIGVNIVAEATGIGDSPTLETLLGTVRVMLEAFDNGQIDRLYIVNNEFINTMAQKPVVDAVLPIQTQNPQEEIDYHWDYIYEPDSKEVVDVLLTRYIESLVLSGRCRECRIRAGLSNGSNEICI